MKIFNRIISIICVAICVSFIAIEIIFPSLARDVLPISSKHISKTLPYISPTPGKISIVASTISPQALPPDTSDFTRMAQCGFNLAIEQVAEENLEDMLHMMEGSGIRLMISNPALRNIDKVEAFIEKFKGNPMVGGWDLADEPRYSTLDNLSKCYRKIQATDSTHLVYVNLIGGNNRKFTGSSPTYPAYLDSIQRIISPQVWSYDLYPIADTRGKVEIAFNAFYYNFEIFSALSKATGRPFWAYCMTQQYTSEYMSRPAPTESQLRWEIFSALAYGAQGIVYWTYAQRQSTPYETYYTALINSKGEETPIWHAARRVNQEIARYNDVFYGCRLIDARHTGHKNYQGTLPVKGKIGPLHSISTPKQGVLVSLLQNFGRKYLIIVNHDPDKSQITTLQFERNAIVKQLLPDNSESCINNAGGKSYKYTLPAGGYLIFQYK